MTGEAKRSTDLYKLKSTSSVRGKVLSLPPLFPLPPLGSFFGFKSRTVIARFFSAGWGVLVSSGITKFPAFRLLRFFASKQWA
jgi:hypothetical protein